jgi:hypothetical protein
LNLGLHREQMMPKDHTTVRRYYKQLQKAPRRAFPQPRQRLDCPRCQGVYIIFDRDRNVAHVGRTTRARSGLAQRLRAHLAGRSSFVVKFLRNKPALLRRGYSYSFVEVPDARHRALVEAYATGMLCPRHIGTGEAPV